MIDILFTSKKDALYFLVIWGTIIFVFLVIIFNLSLNFLVIFSGIIGLMTIGIIIWIWFDTVYQIDNNTIKIRYGPFKWVVHIQDISSIGKRKKLLATPALAMDRILLRYGKYGEILISPKNENEFIHLLLIKNPQIKVDESLSDT